jgi:hypothetical protein
MNILSLVSQNLDNFYQIQTKCYRNSDTVFFFPIHLTKGGLYTRLGETGERRATNARNHSIVQALVISEAGLCGVALGKDPVGVRHDPISGFGRIQRRAAGPGGKNRRQMGTGQQQGNAGHLG